MVIRIRTRISPIWPVIVALATFHSATCQTFANTNSGEGDQDPNQPTATIIINERFFNAILDAIFNELRPPRYPLKIAESPGSKLEITSVGFNQPSTNDCEDWIELEREVDGVKSAFHLKAGVVEAPLAFRGSYNIALMGCVEFRGWAETKLSLNFDEIKQNLSGHIDVENIHLSGMRSAAGGVLIPMVQAALDRKINPIQIVQSAQLSTKIPVSSAGGNLQMKPKSITPEIVPGELRLHIIYGFSKDQS